MFFPEARIRVHLYGRPCDMRKSFDGLSALTRQELGCDPLDGGLYVYVNRRGTQVKCLYFDRSGYCVWSKRLEAGRFGHGKMKTAYFWPVYGEQDEVCFPYRPSRAAEHVRALLGARPPPGTVLVTDGYAACAAYAKAAGITHAQCWVHARREVFEAQAYDPERARVLLEHIAGLFTIEARIRAQNLTGEAKRLLRVAESKPRVEALFAHVEAMFAEIGLLPATPFTTALGYVRDRKAALSVFLEDPDVPLDTNHLERALRPVPTARSLCTPFSSVCKH
jgi:hypothetical protein